VGCPIDYVTKDTPIVSIIRDTISGVAFANG
jgi:hypothetical protein